MKDETMTVDDIECPYCGRVFEEENTCHNCEYWMEKYQQCEHPEQRQEECGEYMAPPSKTCELWESAI